MHVTIALATATPALCPYQTYGDTECSRSITSEATSPAAAGLGSPLKLRWADSSVPVSTLNRASRIAAHAT